MLKATMKNPRGSGSTTLLRDFMVLEEGETLVSVRNPAKRQEALDLLEQIKVEYDTNCTPGKFDHPKLVPLPGQPGCYRRIDGGTPAALTARFNAMTNRLFQMLLDNFLPTRPPEEREMVEEIGQLLRNSEINLETCYNSTFCIHVIRKALKDYKLPIIQARLWKTFAGPYCALVMAS